jgi:uncharacterized C2H2 Zn-finger protein
MDCRRCGKTFLTKTHLIRHLRNAKPCKAIKEDIDVEKYVLSFKTLDEPNSTFQCKTCDKSFKHRSNLSRHSKTCTQQNIQQDVVDFKINELRNELRNELKHEFHNKIQELQNEISILKQSTGEVHNNIQINNFNTPVDKLAEHLINHPNFTNIMLECFKDTKNGLRTIMHNLFYNKDNPQNHIIYKESLDTDETLCRVKDNWVPMSDIDAIHKVTQTTDRVITSFVTNPHNNLQEDDENKFVYYKVLPLNMANDVYVDTEEPHIRTIQKKKIIQKYRKDITECSKDIKNEIKQKAI